MTNKPSHATKAFFSDAPPTASALGLWAQLAAWLRQAFLFWAFAAQLTVVMLSARSYTRSAGLQVMQQIVSASAVLVPGFMVFSALMSVVLVRIVLAAADELGVSQFALNLLIRTLVLELLPLVAAGFVALRYSLPAANAWARHPGRKTAQDLASCSIASVFAVLLLALSSAVMASVIAYVSVYGLSFWGLASFNALMAQIVTPTVMLVLVVKTVCSAVAVAVVPLGAVLMHQTQRSDLGVFARLVALLLLIELLSLLGNYY
ncbi:ABC transporter permease [Comamonadaceae bacterium M7527]|nr:ABC transporter permease [Comamonadaceae bacterium M7527]